MKRYATSRAAQAARNFLAAMLAVFAFGTFAPASYAQQQPPAFEPKPEDPEDYPDNPGRDDAFYGCTACHGFKIVAAQGFTRERWNETIDIMIERHGAPKLDAKDRKTILDYLEKTFPPKAPGNRGFQNPFLNQ